MPKLPLGPVSPFFIVGDVRASASYYVDCLGFGLRFLSPRTDPFFAIVGRDEVQFFLKAIAEDIQAQPNSTIHEWAPWDAFVHTRDPAGLCSDFEQRSALIARGLHKRDDGLTGFEVRDRDGYVLFFGHPD